MGYPLNIWKRTATGLLALVYLLTTLGTVVSTHYCMGHVVSVRWTGFGTPADPCGPSAATHGCCHSDFKVFKLGDVHQGSAVCLTFVQAPALPAVFAELSPVSLGTARDLSREGTHGPPGVGVVPLYLQYCHFRI